jgi:hypothetical protein
VAPFYPIQTCGQFENEAIPARMHTWIRTISAVLKWLMRRRFGLLVMQALR